MPPHASLPGTIGSFAGSVAIVVGTFLPWASSKGMVLKGFEGMAGFIGSAGFFTISLGVVGTAIAIANLLSRKMGGAAGVATILIGLAAAGLGALQITQVRIDVGIGLYLIVAGGVDLIAAGGFHLAFKPSIAPTTTMPQTAPASR